MATKKLDNFMAYHALFPEYRVVWLGDSGQGDMLVGKGMLRQHDKWTLELQQYYKQHAQRGLHRHAVSHGALSAVSALQAAMPGSVTRSPAMSIGKTRSALASPVSSPGGSSQPPMSPMSNSTPTALQHVPVLPAASHDADDALAPGSGADSVHLKWEMPMLPPPPLVLIHDVANSSQKRSHSQAARAVLRAEGIHLFDSYVEAAWIAFEHGVIGCRGLLHVIDGAAKDLAAIKFNSDVQRIARLTEFHEAARRAMAAVHRRATAAAPASAAATTEQPSVTSPM